jgi:hypothetical protein
MAADNNSESFRQSGRHSFEWALIRGQLGQTWAALTRHQRHLAELKATSGAKRPGGRYAGVNTVPVNAIRGSEGRTRDFDADFNPLTDNIQDRWVSIYTAQKRGAALPPVELIRVAETYFVRDGHHRVSVARAMGQEYIEAVVTAWE